jgi:hypothetical protein
MLILDFSNLYDQHEELRRIVLGSDYESEENSDDYDEDGILMVDANAPDPVVTEVILSHAKVSTLRCLSF